MSSFFSDLWLFVWTIISNWVAYAGGGLIALAINLFERLSSKHRLTRKAYVSLFVVVFLLIAFFMVWRDERNGLLAERKAHEKTTRELEGERKRDAPDLHGEIQLAGIGRGSGNLEGATLVILWVTIRNLGAASIVDNYRFTIEIPNKGTTKLGATNFWGSITLNDVVDVPRGRKLGIRIDSNGQLFEKTQEHLIPTGGLATGVLMFVFKSDSQETVNEALNTSNLSYTDVTRKQYTIKPDFTGKAPPVYLPGAGLELLPPEPENKN